MILTYVHLFCCPRTIQVKINFFLLQFICHSVFGYFLRLLQASTVLKVKTFTGNCCACGYTYVQGQETSAKYYKGFRINVFHVQCKLYFLNSLLREETDLFASLSSKKRLYYLLNKG